jgi:hypothetical protein
MLEVRAGERTEAALVDVCVSRSAHVGSRALWDPDLLTELYCAFAEPDGIGLSSVAGQLCPSRRDEPDGVALRLGPPDQAQWIIHAPIAPGLIRPVGVYEWRPLPPGQPQPVRTGGGVIALDGEREIEFGAGQATPIVRLRSDGPRCVDVSAVLAVAARDGLLRKRKERP